MIILVVNAGSSSLKYQLIDMKDESVIAKGNCDRIGIDGHLSHKTASGVKVEEDCAFPTHAEAFERLVQALTTGEGAVISSMSEISAVGHRIVQGAEVFTKTTMVTDEIIEKIDELAELAPLHNKAALMGIRACQKHMPNIPMVAVFDTSFFQTLPPKAYMYPLPYEYYEKYAIRKYGAHGTSHRYISERAAVVLDEPLEDLKLITCHLGNGCSMSAIDHGVAVDTSMGLTPLDGLMMGTRCGAIDPAIVPFLMEHENLTTSEVNDVMNKKSGLLGISGVSNDLRSVRDASEGGNERAQLALDKFAYEVRKYIGSYAAAMGGVDIITFTAGVGENGPDMRESICEGLGFLGVHVDHEKNQVRGKETDISAADSTVKVYVIPTNEELMIARDTLALVTK